MKLTSRSRWTLCALALLLLAGLPQAALACGYACVPLSYDPSCDACQYLGGGGSGGCVQTGPCSCYEIQCGFAATPEDLAAATLGFFPADLQPAAACTDAPGAALVAD